MKRIYRMIMPVMLAALLCGCGDGREYDEREDSRRESRDREESDDRPEESTPEESAPKEEGEESLLTSAFTSAKPGNELQFGTCEQDNNLSNGAEPIEWVVLANEGDKILVLSKYVLDGEISYKWNEQVTWATSAERELLNSTFYEEAFSEEEKRCILESSITTPDTEGFWRGRNQSFHTYGGSLTSDFLFFLSSEEVEEYVQPLGIATAETTAASTVRVEESTGYSWWLLRSPGLVSDWPDDKTVTARGYSCYFAAIDAENGNQYLFASDHMGGGDDDWTFLYGRLGKAGDNHAFGMRPAMWLTLQ